MPGHHVSVSLESVSVSHPDLGLQRVGPEDFRDLSLKLLDSPSSSTVQHSAVHCSIPTYMLKSNNRVFLS